jgi:hypothetical protein
MIRLVWLVLALSFSAVPAIAGSILVTGAGEGGGPHVKVFDAETGAELISFYAFDPGFAGGVRVAAADVNGDGIVDVIVAAGPGGGPHVRVFDGAALLRRELVELRGFMAYDVAFAGGVFIAAGSSPARQPLRIMDSSSPPKEVGPVISLGQAGFGLGFAVTMRTIQGVPIIFSLGFQGPSLPSGSAVYTTDDCTGTPYFSQQLVRTPFTFRGHVYLPNMDLNSRIIRSYDSPDPRFGPCSSFLDPAVFSVVTISLFDQAELLSGFVPPFTVAP